jgi:uncharacterized protein YcfJ
VATGKTAPLLWKSSNLTLGRGPPARACAGARANERAQGSRVYARARGRCSTTLRKNEKMWT